MNESENDLLEIGHYVKIIEYFEKEDNPDNREIFRDLNLVELMDNLEQDPGTQEVVKNSIIIMNALIDENYPPDRYNQLGLSSEELTEEQREELRKKLKEEC